MFCEPMPDVEALYYAVGIQEFCGHSISATGLGESPPEATVRRDAELAERVAFLAGPLRSELRSAVDIDQRFGSIEPLPQGNEDVPCVYSVDLATQLECWIPSNLVPSFHHPSRSDRFGLAAGADTEMARFHALCEAVERSSAQNWWSGHAKALQPADSALLQFASVSERWRRRSARTCGLIQIRAAGDVPVLVAWSCYPDGYGMCFGTACHPEAASAAEHALRELLQMELGLEIARYRARNGVEIGDREQTILHRAKQLHHADCRDLLEMWGQGQSATGDLVTSTSLATHLASSGVSALAIDLDSSGSRFSAALCLCPVLDGDAAEKASTSGHWTRWDLYG